MNVYCLNVLRRTITVLLLLITHTVWGQTEVIFNKYAAVLDTGACNSFIVDNASDFALGDTVLLIQMKGAVIDTSNTTNFGAVADYGGAGNYEYNVVAAINGNEISFRYIIARTYQIPEGKVQVVKVPSFQNYTVNQPHGCQPWDGSKGGVFAVYVTNTLTLNNKIDVSGKGFRGAAAMPLTQVGPVNCSNTNYYMSPDVNQGSRRGEGISEVSLGKSFGRGKLANGGGGGNAHNAGGGGGGNAGPGGIGGNEYYGCNSNAANNITGGIGGLSLPYTPLNNKIFLGGGGGAAQINNFTVSDGGNGGGICILTATTLAVNGGNIYADGADALPCVNNGTFGSCHDGMGGGGAGGTILLDIGAASGSLNISAQGGDGADENAIASYFQVGPGGGGGGGLIWQRGAAILPGIAGNVSGGANGIITYNNNAWGAQPGQGGIVQPGYDPVFPTSLFNGNVVADFDFDRTACYAYHFNDQSTPAGSISSWSWSLGGTASVQQNPAHTFPGYGTYTVSLTVTDAQGCSGSVAKEINIAYTPFADAGQDVSVCADRPAVLQASGGLSYSWSPVNGLSAPNAAATTANVNEPTVYTVTVTDAAGCIDKDSVKVLLLPSPDIEILSNGVAVSCNAASVRLEARGGISYIWSPGIYCDDSTSATPMVSPPVTTTFTVTGVDADGCSAKDTITVLQYLGSSKVFMPNAFSPNQDGNNEEIFPVVLCDFKLSRFAVFNRWGQQVFVTNQAGKGWNGFYRDKPADSGIYFYYIEGKKNDGSRVNMKGDIALIR